MLHKVSLSLLLAAVMVSCTQVPDAAQRGAYSRGIGVYPGDPAAYSGPALVPAGDDYRNLALLRAARHSSSYDYNLTAQLVTDGIVPEAGSPFRVAVETPAGPLEKREREKLFDSNSWSSITVPGGEDASLTFRLADGSLTADRLDLSGQARASAPAGGWRPGMQMPVPSCTVIVERSADGEHWTEAARVREQASRSFAWSIPLPAEPFGALRLRFDASGVGSWAFQQANFSLGGQPVSVLPSTHFFSAWMSEGTEDEWVSVDLGATARFDRVRLKWVERPLGGVLESSDDGERWRTLASLPQEGPVDEQLPVDGRGRFVRLSGLKAAPGGHIILGEMEVWGRGGVVPEAHGASIRRTDGSGRLDLSGGAWRLQRASEVAEAGEALSEPGFDALRWLPATVPGTVLTSYQNAGAVPDQRYDDDQLQISESYFLDDFWYRDEFDLPQDWAGKEVILHFDGINWKAEVFVNGSRAGRIEGAFTRAAFDVSKLLRPGRNALAVRIIKNDHPGIIKEQNRQTADLNGGVLGADNPTMHCTIGWDWIPTVRGRNIGIWNDVWLSAHKGGVTLDDVFVDTDLPLPSTAYADLKPVVTLTNHSAREQQAEISLFYGDLEITGSATLSPGETRDVELPAARLEQPQLWWPAGYGEPHLYQVDAIVWVDKVPSDSKRLYSGVREMSYTTDGGILDIFVNGRRLIGNGGNWGYPEINLNYRAREYDIAVAYHADMHFTMIRNWVGQTGDEEFWEACDRHGVMVWQDFWLANPADGPNPDDHAMFLANAEDYLRKIRHHPCLALYCGRNEGNPPAALDAGLNELVARLHPGMHYIPHSAEGSVSGYGPYRALPVEEYFSLAAGRNRLHSERGMPNVPTVESLERMLRPEHRWPQDDVWGMHDFALQSAQSAATFNGMVEKAFGEPESLEQFAERAQWINYNGYRAMYESRSAERKGLIIWMSHSCWPSMVWQTYDYYFAPTAAYFGAKKGSAPIRIQWNPVSARVEVVNNNAGDLAGLTASLVVAAPDGTVLLEDAVQLDAREDSTMPLSFEIPAPAGDSPILLLRLRLAQGAAQLADNFYVLNPSDPGNLQSLNDLPSANVAFRHQFRREGGDWVAVAALENRSKTPALMLRLNAVGARSGEQILPVFYEDNWISLLPGERKQITVRLSDADTRGEHPKLELTGFNL